MPIPARTVVPANAGFFGKPQVPVPERWQHTFVSITGNDGEGETIPLTGFQSAAWPAIVLQPGATGLDMPPFELHTDDSPNLDGGMFRSARAAARQVLLPVFVYGIDRKTLRDFKRRLANALNPKRGYCVLTFIEQDGAARFLKCYYAGGMEGSESIDNSGFRWVSYGIQLTALDPWFYSDSEVAADWSFGQAHPFLGNKFLPLQISSGSIATDSITVHNPGDIEAWPIWTITGPVRSLKFTGPDGSSWGFNPAEGGVDFLPVGRTLTVDCRPGFKTVTDDQGKNYFPLLEPGPSLWSVPPGTSTIQTDLVAGSGTPTVSINLVPRYATY